MGMLILPEEDAFHAALATLRQPGGLAALPTDSTYGLIARASDEAAIERLLRLKGRSADKPLPYLFGSTAWVGLYCAPEDDRWQALAECFWPGPLNLVLPAGELLPRAGLADGETVACRVPARGLLLRLLAELGEPLVAPSANPGGDPPALAAAAVDHYFPAELDLIVDGGPVASGLTSTILDLTGDRTRLLRPGLVPVEEIERLIGKLE